MVDSTQLDPDTVAEQLSPLFTDPGVELVVLFGSVARGQAHARSDVDLAILQGAAVDDARWVEVARMLGTDRLDLVDLRRASPLIAMVVAREGRPLFERTPGRFASFCSLALRRYNDTRKLRDAERESVQRFLRDRGPG